MNISSSKQERGVLVALAGRMDAVTAAEFVQACDPWIKGGEKYIVADLSRLEYISSMGLGSLLSVAKELHHERRQAGDLRADGDGERSVPTFGVRQADSGL